MRIKLLLLSLVATFLSGTVSVVLAQKKAAAEIKRINTYQKSLDRLTRRHPEPDTIFADTADYDQEKAKWRRFNSTKALEKFREDAETYTIAESWKQNGRIVVSNFTLFSPSGDWAKYVYHYFRADGSLAKVTSEFRTFYGDYIVIEDIYFDTKGHRLKRKVKYFDLTTKKPKEPTSDFLSDNSMASEIDYFKRTNLLPFAILLKTK